MGRFRALPLTISLLLLLTGCGGGSGGRVDGETAALEAQRRFSEMTGCTCQAALTADYGDRVFRYVLDVVWDRAEGGTLTIVEPELVRGVTARVQAGETTLSYDGFSLDAGPITSGGLSPVEALPTLYRELCRGYIAAAEVQGEALTVIYRDPEGQPGTGLETVAVFDAATGVPRTGELFENGVRVVEIQLKDLQGTYPEKDQR